LFKNSTAFELKGFFFHLNSHALAGTTKHEKVLNLLNKQAIGSFSYLKP